MLKSELSFIRIASIDRDFVTGLPLRFCDVPQCTSPEAERYEYVIPYRVIDPMVAPGAPNITLTFGICDRHYFYRPRNFKHAINFDTMDIDIKPMETLDNDHTIDTSRSAVTYAEPLRAMSIAPQSDAPQSDDVLSPCTEHECYDLCASEAFKRDHPDAPASTDAPDTIITSPAMDHDAAIILIDAMLRCFDFSATRNAWEARAHVLDRPLTIAEMCAHPQCELAHLPNDTLCPRHSIDARSSQQHRTIRIANRSYTIECTSSKNVPYMLVGTRGGRFRVVRNQHNPKTLFVDSKWFDDVGLTDRTASGCACDLRDITAPCMSDAPASASPSASEAPRTTHTPSAEPLQSPGWSNTQDDPNSAF